MSEWQARLFSTPPRCSVRKNKLVSLAIQKPGFSEKQGLGWLFCVALVFVLVGCAPAQSNQQPTATLPSPLTPRPPTPLPTASPLIQNPTPSPSLPEPLVNYPPSRDDVPSPQTIVARAARHLAGWLHTPLDEIQVVDVKAIDHMPSLSDNSCSSRWESLDDVTPTAPAQGRLLTLQVRGKNYGYYALGEALLLCPIQLP